MPTIRNRTVLQLRRGLGASLELDARFGPDVAAEPGPTPTDRPIPAETRPERIVWIFGAPRTGSTWLCDMMDGFPGQTVWREPMVGAIFGHPYYVLGTEAHREVQRANGHYILGRHRASWLRAIRFMVLDGAAERFPGATRKGHLIIKEPNGSMGAPLLMEALPESSLILLVRDPRDAVASALDAGREGGWWAKAASTTTSEQQALSVDGLARTYLLHVGNARQAYEAHRGCRVLVRYEDLRADTLGEMERIYAALRIAVDRGRLAEIVRGHAWENLPDEQKGAGRFLRKARPGSWREDLSPEQVATIERITAPLLEMFYPAG